MKFRGFQTDYPQNFRNERVNGMSSRSYRAYSMFLTQWIYFTTLRYRTLVARTHHLYFLLGVIVAGLREVWLYQVNIVVRVIVLVRPASNWLVLAQAKHQCFRFRWSQQVNFIAHVIDDFQLCVQKMGSGEAPHDISQADRQFTSPCFL